MVDLAEPDTLNPIVSGGYQIDSDLSFLWGGYFFDLSDQDRLVPDLATVEPTLANGGIAKDGVTITYHLRPGVTWQDGAPFGAGDVIFTWHAIVNPRNNVASTVGYDDVRAIDKRDEHTIVVHLKRPYAPFVATFFGPSSSPYPVLPAHLLARYPDINHVAFNSRPVGTGPFVVDTWHRGSKIVFHANPHYWRGPPKLREIWYSPIGDENTIVTLLDSHEADLEYNGSSQNFAELRSIPGFRTVLTPFTQYSQIIINTRSPELADARVRQALWSALDVPGLIRDVSHGVDVPGFTDQPSFSWAYDPNARHYPHDPAAAERLLDAAGWTAGPDGIRAKGGRRLSITFGGVAGSAAGNAVAVIAQRAWRDVGIDAQVKTYTSSLFFASAASGGILQSGKFDVAFDSWINGFDPDDSLTTMCDQLPPHGQNDAFYCDPRVDAAERLALNSYDPATRKRAYAAVQELLAQAVPEIIPWYARRITVENSDLKDYRPAHAVTSWWNSYEWDI
jgi:peptide/nickel transport system substrate-binding protein